MDHRFKETQRSNKMRAESAQINCTLIYKGSDQIEFFEAYCELLTGGGDRYIQLFDEPVQAAAVDAE